MSIEATAVAPNTLLAEVARLKAEGYRLVTLTSVELDATDMEILYHFDKDLRLKNLRVQVAKGGQLPSISGVLFGAFLVENEIRDQFAITFTGLAPDYQGKLYSDCAQTPASSPFCQFQIRQAEPKPVPEPGPSDTPGAEEAR